MAPCNLAGRRFAHQRLNFRRSARIDLQKKTIFEALGQIRANRAFSPIRIQIRVIRVQSSPAESLLSIFWRVDSKKNGFFKVRIDQQVRNVGA